MAMDPATRERLRALLESNHRFPTRYYLSVITFSREEVAVAVRGAVHHALSEPLPAEAWQVQASGGGKYTSHRVHVPVESVEDVLALYDRVWAIEGVVTVL